MSAWIETIRRWALSILPVVALLVSAWIETHESGIGQLVAVVALLVSAWIETLYTLFR